MRTKIKISQRKVAVIGVGHVGSSIAYAIALKDVANEIVLIDSNYQKTVGEAKDIRHGLSSMGICDVRPGDFSDCVDCDLIIITAGRGRKAGESRLDLTAENIVIMKSVIDEVKKYYNGGVILIVANPVDVLTYKVDRWMGLPNGMVFGSGCILDTSRFLRVISDHIGVSPGVVHGYIVGEHADEQVPIWSHVTVNGFPIAEYCKAMDIPWNEDVKDSITSEIKEMGGHIIASKGRTQFGIATCVCKLADAILSQRPTIMSVSSLLMGENGIRDVAMSVPSVIGPAGVQQRIHENWSSEEYDRFFNAGRILKEVLLQV